MTLPYITLPISSVSETLSRLICLRKKWEKNTSRGFWARHLSRFLFDHLFSLFQASACAHHGGAQGALGAPMSATFFELMDCITVKWMAGYTLVNMRGLAMAFWFSESWQSEDKKTWHIKTASDVRIYRKIYPPFSKKSCNQSNQGWQILRLHLGSSCLGLRLSMTGWGSNEGWIGAMTIEFGFSDTFISVFFEQLFHEWWT